MQHKEIIEEIREFVRGVISGGLEEEAVMKELDELLKKLEDAA